MAEEEDEGVTSTFRWDYVAKILDLHANQITGRPKKHGKEGSLVHTIGEAVDPSDLVIQVLTKFFRDQSKPNSTKPLTEKHLIRLLKRAISNAYIDLLRKIESRKTDYADDLSRPSDEEGGKGDFFDSYKVKKVNGFRQHQVVSDLLPSPEEEDPLLKYREELSALYERVKGDTQLEEVVEAICEEGLEEPRDIAVYLKTTPQDIYNRFKRLRRRYGDLQILKPMQKKAI